MQNIRAVSKITLNNGAVAINISAFSGNMLKNNDDPENM